jgi:hypothetical protein
MYGILILVCMRFRYGIINLYLFAQMLFKPAGSVTPPPSIGTYDGTQPVSMGMGCLAWAAALCQGQAHRVAESIPSLLQQERMAATHQGDCRQWIAKDGDNNLKFDFR